MPPMDTKELNNSHEGVKPSTDGYEGVKIVVMKGLLNLPLMS